LKEKYLSHRPLADYDAILDAAAVTGTAWPRSQDASLPLLLPLDYELRQFINGRHEGLKIAKTNALLPGDRLCAANLLRGDHMQLTIN
jgi:hypothetical protein